MPTVLEHIEKQLRQEQKKLNPMQFLEYRALQRAKKEYEEHKAYYLNCPKYRRSSAKKALDRIEQHYKMTKERWKNL